MPHNHPIFHLLECLGRSSRSIVRSFPSFLFLHKNFYPCLIKHIQKTVSDYDEANGIGHYFFTYVLLLLFYIILLDSLLFSSDIFAPTQKARNTIYITQENQRQVIDDKRLHLGTQKWPYIVQNQLTQYTSQFNQLSSTKYYNLPLLIEIEVIIY